MGKFGLNWLIGNRDRKFYFGENACSILYINVFERYDQFKKKIISKTILVFDFTSVYQTCLNQSTERKKLKMFEIFLPIFMFLPTPNMRCGGFSRGAICFPNKYAETNISAKFDAYIRNANV